MHECIERVAATLNIDISALKRANEQALKDLKTIGDGLQRRFPLSSGMNSGIDVVFLGSYGRGEATKGSDRDYLVILHRLVNPSVPPDFIIEVERICTEIGIPKPGGGGLFAEIAIALELYIRIGLEIDTNVNISRRLLLLMESVSVYSVAAHEDLIKKIIDRYCIDHDEDLSQANPARVPRFLLNDLVRYWRTIAVDFGAKRWRALADDWHVRYGKLLVSRKILFAGALASLFLTPKAVQAGTEVRDHLYQEFTKPSLARLAGIFDDLGPGGKEAIGKILQCYNRFIEILDGHQVEREALVKGETPAAQKLWTEMRKLGAIVQEGLEQIFYDDPLFLKITRRYGLF